MTEQILSMTPAEVYAFAATQAEQRTQVIRQQAWLTARLIGIAKVPDFDVAFPKKPVEADATADNLAAFFSGLGAKIVKH